MCVVVQRPPGIKSRNPTGLVQFQAGKKEKKRLSFWKKKMYTHACTHTRMHTHMHAHLCAHTHTHSHEKQEKVRKREKKIDNCNKIYPRMKETSR